MDIHTYHVYNSIICKYVYDLYDTEESVYCVIFILCTVQCILYVIPYAYDIHCM